VWLSGLCDDLLVALVIHMPLVDNTKYATRNSTLVPYTADLLAGVAEIYQISLSGFARCPQQVVTEARQHMLIQMGWETLLLTPPNWQLGCS